MTSINLEPPSWVADAVFYQIFPDRFARSGRVDLGMRLETWDESPTFHGYKGGDLWGVADKLDYLADLGITALWFNPIFQSASNHRYHTHDYFRVDPVLGGDEAFDAVLEGAKKHGIRVVLDGVFNHASRGFFQFSDIAEHQEKSAFLDWFNIGDFPVNPYDEDTPATYDAWWGLHALPKFNTESEAVREYLWSVGTYWVDRGIDGWRLDVPNEISTPGFWDEFRRRVRASNPEAYITGEIWHEAKSWVYPEGSFDGVMNYPLTTSTIAFCIGNRINPDGIVQNFDYHVTPGLNAGEFADRIDELMDWYEPGTRIMMLNLLDSHDTGRITTMANGDHELVILCLVILLTMPGAPCLYYGTEVGLEGGPDPDSRRGFPWDEMDDQPEINTAVRELIQVRKAEAGLRSSSYERLGPAQKFGRTYVFARGTGADRVVVAINHADEPDVVPVTNQFGAKPALVWGTATLGTEQIDLPARGIGIWKDPR